MKEKNPKLYDWEKIKLVDRERKIHSGRQNCLGCGLIIEISKADIESIFAKNNRGDNER